MMYVFGVSYILTTLLFMVLKVDAAPLWSWSAITTMLIAMGAFYFFGGGK